MLRILATDAERASSLLEMYYTNTNTNTLTRNTNNQTHLHTSSYTSFNASIKTKTNFCIFGALRCCFGFLFLRLMLRLNHAFTNTMCMCTHKRVYEFMTHAFTFSRAGAIQTNTTNELFNYSLCGTCFGCTSARKQRMFILHSECRARAGLCNSKRCSQALGHYSMNLWVHCV